MLVVATAFPRLFWRLVAAVQLRLTPDPEQNLYERQLSALKWTRSAQLVALNVSL